MISSRRHLRSHFRCRRRPVLEELEPRINPSPVFIPPPFQPTAAEQIVLNQANSPLVQNAPPSVLDAYPIPFEIYTQVGDHKPVITHAVPDVPIPINADGDILYGGTDTGLLTGVAGFDLIAQLKTEITPTPHLVLEIDRIGSGSLSLNLSPLLQAQIVYQTNLGIVNYVQDVTVLFVFPFEAFNRKFNHEVLPGLPNLFAGYRTSAANDQPGGILPAVEQMVLTPNIPGFPQVLGGVNHTVELQLNTFGANNPIRYLGGVFHDVVTNPSTGARKIVDANGLGAYVETPPQNITIDLDVKNAPRPDGTKETSFDVHWAASSRTLVEFDYIEDENFSQADHDANRDDYATTLTIDQMPRDWRINVTLTEPPPNVGGSAKLTATADSTRFNEVINKITLRHRVSAGPLNGLQLIGTATDVPSFVKLILDPKGSASLDVNANTLDLQIEALKAGGFVDTDAFLGYDLGYASLKVTDVPDLTATWDGAAKSYEVHATNAGESIGSVEFLLDDDAHYLVDALNNPTTLVGLELPPSYAEGLNGNPGRLHHLFSVIDGLNEADNTRHGTAVARLVHVAAAALDLDADASEAFTLLLGQAAPLQAYLRTHKSQVLDQFTDVEATVDIDDVPAGQWDWDFDAPTHFGYTTIPAQGIGLIHAFGHLDKTQFDAKLGDLPAIFRFDLDPNGSLALKAENGTGPNSGVIGFIDANVWDPDGPGLLPESAVNVLGVNLRQARLRIDHVPSFHATWSDDDAGTSIDFNTDADDAFLGGVQFALSTLVDLDPLAAATPTSHHFARFIDHSGGGGVQMAAGVFGIDQVSYASDDVAGTMTLHYDTNTDHVLDVLVDADFGGLFFPDLDVFASLAVNAIPQTWDFTTDMRTQFVYEASSAIAAVTLVGTVDITNNGVADGTDVLFALVGLPSQVRVGIIPDVIPIFLGRLFVGDGMLAGVRVIGGALDVNGDGSINAFDDGSYFGIPVVNGLLDVDGDGDESGSDADDHGELAGAELKMNGPINSIATSLSSVNDGFGIFGSDYRLIFASLSNVPDHVVLSYGDGRFLLETSVQDPNQLLVAQAVVSTSMQDGVNAAKIEPFTLPGPTQGGPVLGDPAVVGDDGPGGSRISYSPFLQEIDRRYYNEGIPTPTPSHVLSRLALLHADSESLNVGEDHAVVRKEDADGDGEEDDVGFASLQLTGLQHVSWLPDDNGGTFTFRAPGRGDRSLFAGFEEADVFTTLEISNIPEQIVVDIDKTREVIYSASTTIDEIDFYRGPLPMADDEDEAMRGILLDVPAQVHIGWSFEVVNGGAFLDASSPFDLLFLTQDGDKRITAGAQLEDLHLGYGLDLFSFDVTKTVDLLFAEIPVAWEILHAFAGVDNNADGLEVDDLMSFNPGSINGNGSTPIAGFFSVYDLLDGGSESDDSPLPLNGGGPAPGASEYVPVISVMLQDFREFRVDFTIELDPTNLDAELWPIDLELNIDTSKSGNLIFDFWSSDNTFFSDNDDIPFIDEVGFRNHPDYTDNTPFHILPGIFEDFVGNGLAGIHPDPDEQSDLIITFDGWHGFGDHFDPFAGTPPPFGGSSGTGGFDPGAAQFEAQALPAFSGALQRWRDAGLDDATIDALAHNVDVQATAFAGTVLGMASGSSAGGTIQIDPDAGGFAWFIDATPSDDAEFGGGPPPADLTANGGGPAAGKLDMLTFFAHEIGHLLGLDHTTLGVLQSTLPRGIRRLPVAADLSSDPPGDPADPSAPDDSALRVEVSEPKPLASDQAPGPVLVGDRPVEGLSSRVPERQKSSTSERVLGLNPARDWEIESVLAYSLFVALPDGPRHEAVLSSLALRMSLPVPAVPVARPEMTGFRGIASRGQEQREKVGPTERPSPPSWRTGPERIDTSREVEPPAHGIGPGWAADACFADGYWLDPHIANSVALGASADLTEPALHGSPVAALTLACALGAVWVSTARRSRPGGCPNLGIATRFEEE